jgi:hypothetical protein
MTPFALTAELLLAAANSTKCMVTYRPTAAEPLSMPVAGVVGMATQDADPDLRDAVRAMLTAAMLLDNCVERAEEGTDVSLEISTSAFLRKRADRFLPAIPAWPTGKGLADVIDMATWRRKEA